MTTGVSLTLEGFIRDEIAAIVEDNAGVGISFHELKLELHRRLALPDQAPAWFGVALSVSSLLADSQSKSRLCRMARTQIELLIGADELVYNRATRRLTPGFRAMHHTLPSVAA